MLLPGNLICTVYLVHTGQSLLSLYTHGLVSWCMNNLTDLHRIVWRVWYQIRKKVSSWACQLWTRLHPFHRAVFVQLSSLQWYSWHIAVVFSVIRNTSNFTSGCSSVTLITLRLQFVLQPFSGRSPPAFPSCSALNLPRVFYRWYLDATSLWRPPHMSQKSACLFSKTIILFYSCFLRIYYFLSGPRQRSYNRITET